LNDLRISTGSRHRKTRTVGGKLSMAVLWQQAQEWRQAHRSKLPGERIR
jgi:hypothetical protein